ncbi:hypothetical protein G7Y89_g7917 [Cudoniella acicularis]|uniref:CENP-V/GFA domain-containing protein n=1 Tax=Cudoniella acicularis TaxID=354080 RepID=A0A8H4W1I6_9HELO|nr:hypothetical protein G7Y89_g7917 [Cudoniella acicularis]
MGSIEVHISTSQASENAFPKTTHGLKTAVDAQETATIGTLAYYQSSPGVQRYFCKVCSATVFYAWDERPETVDVAVGLLEASDGARTEAFLSWNFGAAAEWVGDTKGGWREGLLRRVREEAE